MASFRYTNPVPQYVSNGGAPVVNGTLTFYETGTSTPKNTYPTQADADASTNPNANPITLNSLGSSPVEIWLNGEYRAILKSALGATIWDRDPVEGSAGEAAAFGTVANIAALRLITPATNQTVVVRGYYANDDGGGGTFVWDSLSSSTDNGGTVINPTGHVGAGRWKRLGPYTFRAFGGKPDGVTDNYAAWLNFYDAGDVLDFGEGDFYFSQKLIVEDLKILKGAGGLDALLTSANTILRFPSNSDGVAFFHLQTSPSGTDGSWSRIQDLQIVANAKAATGRGIYINAHDIRVQNVGIKDFKEQGIRIYGQTGAGNANLWDLDNIRIRGCDSHAVYVSGDNAAAGCGKRIDCSNNGGWGIYDASFLGSTYIACHTSTNTLGPYKSDNANARNVFVGCYSESDQPGSEIISPALVFGGLHGAGFATLSTAPVLTGALGQLRNTRGYESQMETGGGVQVNARLGGDPTNGDILYFDHETNAPPATDPFRLSMSTTVDIIASFANSVLRSPFTLTGPNTALQFGRGAAVPYAFASSVLFTAANSNGRQITHAGAAPTTGTWGRGDIVFSNVATAGGKVGWVCVTAGTPGSWKPFGVIDA